MKSTKLLGEKQISEKSVLEMGTTEAHDFFQKSESYCNVDLPSYFHFDGILKIVDLTMKSSLLTNVSSKPRDFDGVNYSMLSNKDGRHAWRPFQLIHPVLYVSLVKQMTISAQWEVIRARFKKFHALTCFTCLSIPVCSLSRQKDKASQILQWWQGIEQRSIELAMEYEYVFHADITDCYASIYTHSIAWAIHGKDIAKNNRTNKTFIGNIIDGHIQDMSYGQTNGIPQGSVLMDFIAEIVLGYADLELNELFTEKGIDAYHILRYRDDYRIFVNNPQTGEAILKALTEVLIGLGLKLNTSKTTGSQSVICSSLKSDKWAWLRSRQGDESLQKHLLVIHAHGVDYPNAGSLVLALTHFHKRLSKVEHPQNPRVLISIAVDIAYNSPKTFPVCAAIVSKLLSCPECINDRTKILTTIYKKMSQLPNTGLMEVWLQRIGHSYKFQPGYEERLCQLIANPSDPSIGLWNNDWITSIPLKNAVKPSAIVDRTKIEALKPVVSSAEIEVFASERY